MKKIIETEVLGKDVVNPKPLYFSFGLIDDPELKASYTPRPALEMSVEPDFIMLCVYGCFNLKTMEYTPSCEDEFVTDDEMAGMVEFVSTYRELFIANWYDHISNQSIQDYFYGKISFDEMMKKTDFYNKFKEELNSIRNINQFKEFYQKHFSHEL